MIVEAVAITRWQWPEVPALGMITFIDPTKVRKKRDFGRCYKKAGWSRCGLTKGGLIAFQIKQDDMPQPKQPIMANVQEELICV